MSISYSHVFDGTAVAKELDHAIAPLEKLLDPSRNPTKLAAPVRAELTALLERLLEIRGELTGSRNDDQEATPAPEKH
jgi:hypothetical protein